MTYHELPTTAHRHRDGGGFLIGMMAGAAVGGGLALLFAPREGSEMRQGLAASAQGASRKLTQAYGSVAGTARRQAGRFVGRDAGLGDRQPSTAPLFPDTASGLTSGQPRDRAGDANRVLSDAIGEATYEPAATEPSETGPGATSPALGTRSPLV